MKDYLGLNLRRARHLREMTARELGRKADVSHSQILRIEKGEYRNPQYQTILRLAEALNVPPQCLVADDSTTSENLRRLLDQLRMIHKEEERILTLISEIV